MADEGEREFILKLVGDARGDNLPRAKAAFKNCSPAVMATEYGESGKTRNEIIAGYEQWERKIDAAITWLKEI